MDEILIYSDIGEGFFSEGVTADKIRSDLAGKGEVTVRINSPGGDVFQGFAIHNILLEHRHPVNVVVDGLAASAASVIAMAGDTVTMHENSMMMIHDPWTMAMGSSDDMLKTAELLDKIKSSIVTTYVNFTGKDAAKVADQMTAETWFTAAEAVEQGYATNLAERPAKSVNNLVKPWIQNAPKALPTNDDDAQTNWQIALRRRRLDLL